MEEALIIIARLVVPLLILRFPLFGVFSCIALDFLDFSVIGGKDWYQAVDKTLDLYYLSFCVFVVLRWQDAAAKMIGWGTYAWWLLGVIILIATGSQNILLFFPNIFEVFFIFYLLFVYFAKTSQLPRKMLAVIMASLVVPKLVQEYALHVYVPQRMIGTHASFAFFELPVIAQFIFGAMVPVVVLVASIVMSRHNNTKQG